MLLFLGYVELFELVGVVTDQVRCAFDERQQESVSEWSEVYRLPAAPQLLPTGVEFEVTEALNGRHCSCYRQRVGRDRPLCPLILLRLSMA
jgi:hypothetical protein